MCHRTPLLWHIVLNDIITLLDSLATTSCPATFKLANKLLWTTLNPIKHFIGSHPAVPSKTEILTPSLLLLRRSLDYCDFASIPFFPKCFNFITIWLKFNLFFWDCLCITYVWFRNMLWCRDLGMSRWKTSLLNIEDLKQQIRLKIFQEKTASKSPNFRDSSGATRQSKQQCEVWTKYEHSR